jgi:hypothetical protein
MPLACLMPYRRITTKPASDTGDLPGRPARLRRSSLKQAGKKLMLRANDNKYLPDMTQLTPLRRHRTHRPLPDNVSGKLSVTGGQGNLAELSPPATRMVPIHDFPTQPVGEVHKGWTGSSLVALEP